MNQDSIQLIFNLAQHTAVLLEMNYTTTDLITIWDDTIADLRDAVAYIEAHGQAAPEAAYNVLKRADFH